MRLVYAVLENTLWEGLSKSTQHSCVRASHHCSTFPAAHLPALSLYRRLMQAFTQRSSASASRVAAADRFS